MIRDSGPERGDNGSAQRSHRGSLLSRLPWNPVVPDLFIPGFNVWVRTALLTDIVLLLFPCHRGQGPEWKCSSLASFGGSSVVNPMSEHRLGLRVTVRPQLLWSCE